MAEVFGIAAGAVGVAPVFLELAKSVKKLRDFCQDVKTAPQEIQDFAEEVHGISEMLVELEKYGLNKASTQLPGMQLCFSQCNRAYTQFSAVVSALEQNMVAHRLLARVIFPLKKEKIKKLTGKLERGKSALSLACNVYNMTQTQIQHQLLLDVLSRVQNGALGSPQIDEISAIAPMPSQMLESQAIVKSQASYTWREVDSAEDWHSLQATPYLLWRLRDMCFAAATRGWTFYLKSYRTVQPDTLAFQKSFKRCREGDLLGLQRSLCSGEVSLRDLTPWGETLFIMALLHQRMDIARWLHAVGADVTSPNYYGFSPLAAYGVSVELRGFRDLAHVEEWRRNLLFLTEDCGLEAESTTPYKPVTQTILRPTSMWTADDYFTLLHFLALEGDGFTRLPTLNLLLGFIPCDSSLWHTPFPRGGQIIHFIAKACASNWTGSPATQPSWAALLTVAVLGGSDLHALDFGSPRGTGTPLHTFLYFALARCDPYFTKEEILTNALTTWVAALAATGVDLMVYGRNEVMRWTLGFQDVPDRLRIISFVYGPNPTDWRVLTEHPGDRYAGIFWDLVENPDRAVPGSWIEADMILWEDYFFREEQNLRYRRTRWGEMTRDKFGKGPRESFRSRDLHGRLFDDLRHDRE